MTQPTFAPIHISQHTGETLTIESLEFGRNEYGEYAIITTREVGMLECRGRVVDQLHHLTFPTKAKVCRDRIGIWLQEPKEASAP